MSQTDGVGKWTWNSLPEQEFSFEFEFFSNNIEFSQMIRDTEGLFGLYYSGVDGISVAWSENTGFDEMFKTIEVKTPITDAEILNTLTTYATFEATEEPGGGELK